MSSEKEKLVEDLWDILSNNVYSLPKSEIRDLKWYILEKVAQGVEV